jgi:hypothetical protein
MSLFISIARHNGFIVKAIADVAGGWRQNKQGNGYFGTGSLDYPGNRSIEVTLNVRVRPHMNHLYFRTFPEDIQEGDVSLVWNRDDTLGCYSIVRGKLGLLIAVGAFGDQLEKNEDDPIYFDKVILRRGTGRVHIRMQASVCIRSARPQPVGDIPEWDTQFFQGGLPSLGKRRP